jgi:hypothetical protein
LQHDFTGLMTALPDHTAKSFQNLGQSSQVSLKHAEVRYVLFRARVVNIVDNNAVIIGNTNEHKTDVGQP